MAATQTPKKEPEPLRERSQNKPVLSTFPLLCIFVFLDTDDQRRLFPNSSILQFASMEQTPLCCTAWDDTGRFQTHMAHFSRFSLIGPGQYGTSAAFPA